MADIKAKISSTNTSLTAAVNVDKGITVKGLTPTTTTLAQLGLDNVTNESKATMFSNPTFTGTPVAPTATSGTNTTQIATTEFVTSAVATSAGSTTLVDLTDTNITTITDGEIIVYDTATSKYINKTLTEAGILLSSELTTHTSASNPHNISKSTLGLTNVEDKSSATIRSEIVDSDIPSTIARDTEITSAIAGKQDTLTFGIANTNAVKIDSADVGDDEYARFTSSGLEGRTTAELKTDLSLNNVENKSSATIRSEIVDSDIPSTIARDTEITSAVSTHAALSNPHGISASTISLENVTNESKATMFSNPTFTGTVSGITKSMVGLGNVENKSSATIRGEIIDANIPSSITRDSELLAHTSSTSNPHSVTASQINAYTKTEVDTLLAVQDELDELSDVTITTRADNDIIAFDSSTNKFTNQSPGELGLIGSADLTAHTSSTANPHSVTKAQVGLGSVTNESKATMFTSPAFTGTTTANNLTISGDLIINGATTAIDTNRLVVEDNLIELNRGLTTANPNDAGIIIERGTSGNDALLMWDESEDKWALGTTTSGEGDSGDLNITTGTLVADIEGNITGNLTGTILTASQPNITGVGTIGTGVWQGTQIANAYVADLPTSKITSGTFADGRISQSNVTQHQAALSIGASQLTGTIADARIGASSITQHQSSLSVASSQLTGDMPDARIVGSNVTQHQSSLSIGTSQLTGNMPDARIVASNVTQHQGSITSLGTLSNLTVGGFVKLTNANGIEVQKGYFNSGGIRIKHDTSANNEFAIAYEGNLSGGEGEANFKLQLKKSGSQISIIKFKPDGNVFVDGGNFGVGKTSPTSKLHVSGTTALDNAVNMATGSSNNYVGIGTSTTDRKLVIDGNVNIIKGNNNKTGMPVLRTRADDDTGTFIDFGGPVVVTHDLFKNSSVPGGFADNSNHFHTIQKIDRITAQGKNEVKNIERVEEQYYAIQSNNLRNDKAAFWTWHRITRAIGSTDISLASDFVGWNVSLDQAFNNTASEPNGRKQSEQMPFAQSKDTVFTFSSESARTAVLNAGDLIRVTVTTDFVGPFVAQTHFAEVKSVSGATATVVLFAGNYKTKDELPIGSSQTALNDTSTFSLDKIGSTPTAKVNGQVTSSNTVNIDNLTSALNESMYVTGGGIGTSRIQVQEVISEDLSAGTAQIKLSSTVSLSDDTDLSFRNDIALSGYNASPTPTHALTVIDDTSRATGFQKLVQITSDTDHGLEINDTLTIVTDGTGGFQPAEVAHVVEKTSNTTVKLVYGRVFEPASNLALSTISGSSVIGVFKGTLDGIHRYTAGDQLFTFWSNNVGRYKSYQIGPGSQSDGNCIAIGYNTYNKDANTIKIGYDNEMLNIDSAGIDVAGTIDSTDDITLTKSSGTGTLKISGQVATLNLNDSDNSSESTITNTGGDLYYVAEGVNTDYGNHFFMTQRASDNDAKAATMVIDGVNANVGIGTTTPDSSYKLDVAGALRATGAVTFDDDLTVDGGTLFVDDSTNKVQVGDTATTKQKGKLTVVGSNASGTGLAITHNTSTTDFVEMYYKGTASGGPFIMSRSQTGGAEIVLFNNGDINLNGGYKGVTSSANSSKTPDNVGIGVNAATKLNNGNANTNGKPTNKLHIFEKHGLTMGALESPNKDNALVRIEEQTSSDVNMYLDGNMIYGSNVLIFTSDGDITLGPGKSQAAVFKTDGKVGIGVAAPTEALDVSGNILSNGVIKAINSSSNAAQLEVGRNGNEYIEVKVEDLNNRITAYQDGDGNQEHNFIIDRQFLGSGANNLKIQKDGTDQVTVDTSGNLTSIGIVTGTTLFGNFADGSGSSLKLGRADNSNYWLVNHAGNDFRLYNSAGSGSDILLGVDAAGTDKINNVGIKTATPTEALDVNGNIKASGTITSTSTTSRPVQNNENNTNPIRTIERLSQSDYNTLVNAGTVNANTLYIIE